MTTKNHDRPNVPYIRRFENWLRENDLTEAGSDARNMDEDDSLNVRVSRAAAYREPTPRSGTDHMRRQPATAPACRRKPDQDACVVAGCRDLADGWQRLYAGESRNARFLSCVAGSTVNDGCTDPSDHRSMNNDDHTPQRQDPARSSGSPRTRRGRVDIWAAL